MGCAHDSYLEPASSKILLILWNMGSVLNSRSVSLKAGKINSGGISYMRVKGEKGQKQTPG